MSEYFPSEQKRVLWYERRAVVLAKLEAAVEPLRAEGLELRRINGWALWAKLRFWTVDVTTSFAYSGADTLSLTARTMKVTEFGPSRPSVQETAIAFVPETAELTPAGEAALAKAGEALVTALKEGAPSQLADRGRLPRRQARNPTAKAMRLRASYAKAVGS